MPVFPVYKQTIEVIRPLIHNYNTGNQGFEVKLHGGYRDGQVMFADLNAPVWMFLGMPLGVFHTRYDVPTPDLVGAKFVVEGTITTTMNKKGQVEDRVLDIWQFSVAD
ncbi:hypothetical protein BGX23_006746 [Mortierella sp. AD031]|nr:hypothetical protein BGX23_006746 [Mortierella sp. AD031]